MERQAKTTTTRGGGPEADVLVLGAGISGLAAAGELRRAGLDVIVVEARGRVGGRVHTVYDARTPVPVELGPELVHEGSDGVQDLVRALSLGLLELDGTTWVARGGASARRLVSMADFDERVKRGLRAAFARLPSRGDLSMAEALRGARLPSEVRELTHFFVQNFHAGDATRLGARALARGGTEGRGRSLRVHAGYAAVTEGLAGRVADALRLGTVVTSVTWKRGSVVVSGHGPTGQAVTLRARAAIVALPLGVLRAPPGRRGSVAFDPPLDERRTALEGLEMGQVVKITMRFRHAFWTDSKIVKTKGASKEQIAKSAFFFDPRGAFPTFWTARPMQAPVLVAWAGGRAADALGQMAPSKTSRIEAALDGLAALLAIPRAVAHDAIETWFTHDWARDPFSRGAYSYALPGGAASAERCAEPALGTLFFAGEHTAKSPNNGTVHGAFESGRRAASEVIAALPPKHRREVAQRALRGSR